jgi:hypothetical protein
VAEEGTHDELIQRDQIYAELYRIQAGATPAPKASAGPSGAGKSADQKPKASA